MLDLHRAEEENLKGENRIGEFKKASNRLRVIEQSERVLRQILH